MEPGTHPCHTWGQWQDQKDKFATWYQGEKTWYQGGKTWYQGEKTWYQGEKTWYQVPRPRIYEERGLDIYFVNWDVSSNCPWTTIRHLGAYKYLRLLVSRDTIEGKTHEQASNLVPGALDGIFRQRKTRRSQPWPPEFPERPDNSRNRLAKSKLLFFENWKYQVGWGWVIFWWK